MGSIYSGHTCVMCCTYAVIYQNSMFDIYVPEALQFLDYIHVCQVARTWADGYDRKVYQS